MSIATILCWTVQHRLLYLGLGRVVNWPSQQWACRRQQTLHYQSRNSIGRGFPAKSFRTPCSQVSSPALHPATLTIWPWQRTDWEQQQLIFFAIIFCCNGWQRRARLLNFNWTILSFAHCTALDNWSLLRQVREYTGCCKATAPDHHPNHRAPHHPRPESSRLSST